MQSQPFADMKDKLFIIYIDILGYGRDIREEAKQLNTTDDEIRKNWEDKVGKTILYQAKKKGFIISFDKKGGRDSWIAFSESPNNVYNFLNFLFMEILQFEIALDFKAFPKTKDLTRTNEIMVFLKNDIIEDYRNKCKEKKETIKKTFCLITEDTFLALGKDDCWRKPYPEAKYYCFKKDEEYSEKKPPSIGECESVKKKIFEVESNRISPIPVHAT